MSRVIFMCGPAGSGKTTYARRLENDGMVSLSFDVELWRQGIRMVPPPADVQEEIELALRARLLELVAAGTDVVLDFSFWSRRMRDDYRALLAPTGVVAETIYLATDRATVLDRVRRRRGEHFRRPCAHRRACGAVLRPVRASDRRRRSAPSDASGAAGDGLIE